MMTSLFNRTLYLVRVSGKSCREIAEATGVSPAWLWRFSRGKVTTARGDDIQKVYEYLTGKKLELH